MHPFPSPVAIGLWVGDELCRLELGAPVDAHGEISSIISSHPRVYTLAARWGVGVGEGATSANPRAKPYFLLGNVHGEMWSLSRHLHLLPRIGQQGCHESQQEGATGVKGGFAPSDQKQDAQFS